MEARKKEPRIISVRREKAEIEKGADTKKYCGVLKLKANPLVIQKQLRDEWR